MTAGQRLIEKGRQQGVEQGLQLGIEQGRQLGCQQGVQGMLLRLLQQRFGDAVNAHVEQRIATVAVEQLEAWCMRLVSATTLAEVIAD